MNPYIILADATCDLNESFQKQYDIVIVPGHVILPDKSEISAPLTWDRFTREEFYNDLKKHPNDYKNRVFMAAKARELVEKCGAHDISGSCGWPKDGPSKSWSFGGQHQSGSCRMGSDPKKSVTDKWARVWDFPNLFIADGSVHVSNGGMNPVLTIMALAFRTASHIVENRKEVGL